ncbi:MAG: AAA family ATPase, partial [Planctomycetota bacterium]
MRLEKLRIQSTPGIEDPFTLSGFAQQGCTLIYAPNGAGKSSSCRALQALLWPDPEESEQRAVARWTIDGASFRAELQGGRTQWQREGAPSAAPRFPAAHLKDCFRLNVTDLLSASRVTDTGLAEALRSELAGGIRLDRVL